jgi:cytochrome c553
MILLSTRTVGFVFVLALITATGGARASDHLDLRRQESRRGDAVAGAAKADACTPCHGTDGNSTVPMFPRLAGQRVNYLYWRLVAFKRDDPSSSPMPAMVQSLTEADMRNLAAYFAAQAPTADATTTAQESGDGKGQDLYLHGDPTRGIAPCQGCHGAHAAGPTLNNGEYSAYPVLRGQHSVYLAARLTQFRNGVPQRTTNAFIMHGVARTLDEESIQALAAWIEALPPEWAVTR